MAPCSYRFPLILAAVTLLAAGFITLTPLAMAQDAVLANDASAFEQYLFAQTFADEPIDNRLSRLESVIFGAPQAGSLPAARDERLSQVLKPLIQQQQQASQQAQQQAQQAQQAQSSRYQDTADATSYPTVTALERQVIGRDFISQDITERLDRLEQRVFGHTFPQLPLSDRVDRLLGENPGVRTALDPTPDEPAPAHSALDGMPNDSSQFIGRGGDTYPKLELLETNLLGHTSSGHLITERLDQLEERAYGYTYSGEAVDTRLNRLLSNYQNHYAASATQNHPVSSYTNTSSYTGGQNVQIGAGIMSNSQYTYSPELLNMLSPSMRQQVYQQQGTQQQSGYTVGSPGTVVMQQQTNGGLFGGTSRTVTTYSGFNNFGGAPIEYRNTTQMQAAPGTTVTQQYIYPYSPGMLVYTGNPAVSQALSDLETRVYSTVDTTNTVPIRLAKLEMKLSGRTYVGYPDEARIENLNKIYQYQSLGKVLGSGKTGNTLRGVGGILLGIPLNTPAP